MDGTIAREPRSVVTITSDNIVVNPSSIMTGGLKESIVPPYNTGDYAICSDCRELESNEVTLNDECDIMTFAVTVIMPCKSPIGESSISVLW